MVCIPASNAKPHLFSNWLVMVILIFCYLDCCYFLICLFYLVCKIVLPVCVCTHCMCACRGQRKAWSTGIEGAGGYELPCECSARAVHALNHRVISPAPQCASLFLYFNFKNVFCMCVCVWYACGCVLACVCGICASAHLLVFGGQRSTSGFFLDCSLPYLLIYWGRASHINPEHTDWLVYLTRLSQGFHLHLHSWQDLSLIPRTHVKSLDSVVYSYNPSHR